MANESSVLVRLRLLGASAFAGQANRAGRSLNSIGGNGARANSQLKGLNNSLASAGLALKGVGAAAGVGAGMGFAKGVGAAVNFEQSMANVQARLLTTKGNMQLLSNQAIDLGGKTSFSANQAAEAMGEFAAAGFNTNQIMKIMPGTLDLAAASGTDLAFAAETTGAMIRQFGLKSTDASHVADLLTVAVNKSAIGMDDLALTMKYVGPVAGRFNQSIEDVGAAAAILGNVGIKGETAGTTLRRAFVNIVKPSQRTQKVLGDLGITQNEFAKATVDAHGKLRPMPQVLGNLAGHFKDLSAPDQRRALAQLFGVEALPGMLTLMGKGQKGIEAMSRALQNSNGAAKKTAGIMRGTVKGAWDQFTGSLETASIKMTRRAMPAVRDTLKGAAGGVSGFMQGIGGGLQTPLSGFAGFAQKAGQHLRKLGPVVLDAGKQLIDAFKPAMPFFENVLLPLLKGIAIGVIGGVVMAFKVMVPIIKVVATALGWIGQKAAPLKGVFQGVGMVIGFLLTGPILKLLGFLPKVGAVFRFLLVPVKLVGTVFKFVIGIWLRVVTTIAKVYLGVLRFVASFRSAPARIARAAMNIVTTVVQTLGRLPGRMLALGGRIISGIANGVRGRLGSIVSFFGRVGKAIINGIVNVIKNSPGAIAGAIMDVVPGPVKGTIRKLVPGLAKGGLVSRGGLRVVGERGPELAAFPSGTRVYNNQASGRLARASTPLEGGGSFLGHAHLHLDGKEVHDVVFRFDRAKAEMA